MKRKEFHLSEEQRTLLVNVLRDHKDCVRRDDFQPCGRAMASALEEKGIDTSKLNIEEIDSKAPLIWELDGLIWLFEALPICKWCGTRGEHYCPEDVARD